MNEYYWCLDEKYFILNLCHDSADYIVPVKDYHLNTVMVFNRINEIRLGENIYACLHKGVVYGMITCSHGFITNICRSFGDPEYEI